MAPMIELASNSTPDCADDPEGDGCDDDPDGAAGPDDCDEDEVSGVGEDDGPDDCAAAAAATARLVARAIAVTNCFMTWLLA
ncbi:MAG TPA: hypothetical protein VFQ62_06640 [Methylomirabilota bacterium]|nr:hypothetical protein [Methylomirabilota bacterium]